MLFSKGQLISKYLFGVCKFFQKTNENKSTWGIIVVIKLNFFVRFFGPFEINWPLKIEYPDTVHYCFYEKRKKIALTLYPSIFSTKYGKYGME